MTAPRVFALDLSLRATGVAFPDGTTTTWAPTLTGVERLAWFRTVLDVELDIAKADVVVLEEYAFSRAAAHSHELGELGGVVRLALHDARIPWVPVIPSSLKKFATGRGNAGKDEVLAAAIRKLGYAGHSTDEADALWLREMALYHYCGSRLAGVAQAPADAIAKVTWPQLAVA